MLAHLLVPGDNATMASQDADAPIHKRAVLYPDMYAWYLLASALDVMVTVTVLVHLGAREVNTFAQWTLERLDVWGLIGLKFLSVIVVVLICEYVGRRRPGLGRSVAFIAIIASLAPVAAALAQTAYLTATDRLIIEPWPPDDGHVHR